MRLSLSRSGTKMWDERSCFQSKPERWGVEERVACDWEGRVKSEDATQRWQQRKQGRIRIRMQDAAGGWNGAGHAAGAEWWKKTEEAWMACEYVPRR